MYWSLLSPQKLHFLKKENQMLHKENNFLRLWNFAKRQSSGSNPGTPPGWSKISLPSKFSGFHEELQEANLLQSACTVE
jgi:hypothetical protein